MKQDKLRRAINNHGETDTGGIGIGYLEDRNRLVIAQMDKVIAVIKPVQDKQFLAYFDNRNPRDVYDHQSSQQRMQDIQREIYRRFFDGKWFEPQDKQVKFLPIEEHGADIKAYKQMSSPLTLAYEPRSQQD